MAVQIIEQNGEKIAVVDVQEVHIASVQDALDLIGSVGFEHECRRIALYKPSLAESFFVLSTGFAGEIIQKFVNYNVKLAIIGDFSMYTSKPLRDFIYECNNGNNLFFVSTEDEALRRLAV